MVLNILFTIVIGFAVLIAAILFLGCSICAFDGGLSGQGRTMSAVIAMVSLGVMIGGVYLIARINRTQQPPE